EIHDQLAKLYSARGERQRAEREQQFYELSRKPRAKRVYSLPTLPEGDATGRGTDSSLWHKRRAKPEPRGRPRRFRFKRYTPTWLHLSPEFRTLRLEPR